VSRTVAIIQARMTSSRLPGKVLADISGKPSLQRMIERIRPAHGLDEITVATTALPTDDPVDALCRQMGIRCFRGDEQDVLGRYIAAAAAFSADIVVRLTADCPMHDPEVIEAALRRFAEGGYDHVSNAVRRTYPDGLDVEVMSRGALERAGREANHPFLREHVTTYIRCSRPELGCGQFSLGHILNETDQSAMRWTVDRQEDLDRVRRFFAALPENFSWREAARRDSEIP
jgi:spore coat polysaccharide biosynthesis protein SpsF